MHSYDAGKDKNGDSKEAEKEKHSSATSVVGAGGGSDSAAASVVSPASAASGVVDNKDAKVVGAPPVPGVSAQGMFSSLSLSSIKVGLPLSREEKLKGFLVPVSQKGNYLDKNNPLHTALVEDNNYFFDSDTYNEDEFINARDHHERCKQALSELKNSQKLELHMRWQSVLNTPLMLALKYGDEDSAKLILTQYQDSNYLTLKDSRGLTPLDIACMLRMNDVIEMILLLLDPSSISADPWATVLYSDPVLPEPFANYLRDLKGDADKLREKGAPIKPIPEQEPYTDLVVYFMMPIFMNMMRALPPKFGERATQSHVDFFNYLRIGYQDFCTKRNERSINPELLRAMQNSGSLEAWKKEKQKAQASAQDQGQALGGK